MPVDMREAYSCRAVWLVVVVGRRSVVRVLLVLAVLMLVVRMRIVAVQVVVPTSVAVARWFRRRFPLVRIRTLDRPAQLHHPKPRARNTTATGLARLDRNPRQT